MGLSRRGSSRSNDMAWPGFVDAVTTLLMVLMFVLTIFTVMQSVLRDTITTQGNELDALTAQVAGLADALGLERQRVEGLQSEIGTLRSSLGAAQARGEAQAAEIAALSATLSTREDELATAQGRIASFEAQVASLIAERDSARGEATRLTASVDELTAAQTRLMTEQEALNLALAKARQEIDAQTEAARLAAARADAVQALADKLRADNAAQGVKLSDTEAARLVDQAALEELRNKLKSSDTELAALTLSLEEQRKRAEETLTLLAAAQGVEAPETDLVETARALLEKQKGQSAEAERRVALLNQQIAALRGQLGSLQALLDAAQGRDAEAQVQIENLGGQLNSALAQVASEQKRRAELEETERKRLEAEKENLEKYRSEFFGQLRQLLAGREGVRVHQVSIPKGKKTKGRAEATRDLLSMVRSAARGQSKDTQRRVKITLTFANGRQMEVKDYNASTLLNRINEQGEKNALGWLAGQMSKRYTNLDTSQQSITGVTLNVYPSARTDKSSRNYTPREGS